MKKGRVFVYRFGDGLYINLTNSCCNSCEFCLRNNGDGVKDIPTLWLEKEPTFEEVVLGIEGADFRFDEVVFCGYGEPVYRLDLLVRICDYLKENHPKVLIRLNTNGLGSAIQKRDIASDLKGRIDVVSVSLNAENAESYDRVCHSKFGINAYGYLLDFVKSCVNNGIKTVLTVVDVIGEEAIKACQETAKNLGAELRVRSLITDNEDYK